MNVELDIDVIKNKILKINKNIVCFGAGTAGKILIDKLPDNCPITYFTDNNEKNWGKKINNVEIINPQRLLSINNVFVIIISRHVLSIKKQLEEYGFIEGIDFIDAYSIFEKYFQCAKAVELSEEYLKFASGIKEEIIIKQVVNNQKIGIIVLGEMSVQKMFFQITLYLILKNKCYNVKLILDFVGDFADIKGFEGANQFLKELMVEMLDKLETIVGEIKHVWLKEESYELLEEDYAMISINTRDTVKSYSAYIGHKQDDDNFFMQKTERIEKEITKHLMSLKKFMRQEKFEIISVISGVIDRRWNYTYLGHSNGVRVPNYDMENWATDYPACWNFDLKNKLILSEKELNDYAIEGKELFEKRKFNNEGEKGRKQLAEYRDYELSSTYDVLIPLNIMFDAAVFGLDRVFSSPEEWLVETVEYLYENTKAKILIRESPAGPPLASLNYINYSNLLKKYIDNERVFYSDRKEKVNIYKLIESSKVILPYSSTVGLEAAIMDKPVIVHTNCFYANEEFVISAKTKQEYFNKIVKFIAKDKYISESKHKAFVFFYIMYSKKNKNVSSFCEGKIDWIYENFENIYHEDVINNMVNVIAENKIYFNK